MSSSPQPRSAEPISILEDELWEDGLPMDQFARMRAECPVHWTPEIRKFPDEAGFWSVATWEGVREVSLDWETYSSGVGGILASTNAVIPLELQQGMFIAMDPPKHDRLKQLFQRGFTPRRIAEHEPAIRAITREVLDGLAGRETCDLVEDVAQPVVARVICSFMGIPAKDAELWARLMSAIMTFQIDEDDPDSASRIMEHDMPEIFRRCQEMIAQRRAEPTDDLTSVLVHADIDGQGLEEHEIVMGFFLLMAAGNDSTKSTYTSAMKALLEHPDQRQQLLDDPALIPSAVEEALRMFPAFAHFRRTTTKDTVLLGQEIKEGEKVVMWYPSSNRDETRFEAPDRFDVTRNPEHQAFGAGGRHFCLGAALARLELTILLEETLARFPAMEIAGDAPWIDSGFVNQLEQLPVRLNAAQSGGR